MSRRVHSSLDNLPAALRAALTAMVVDNAWPSDFQDRQFEGAPRYEDIVEYCSQQGWSVSKSAIGRWAMQLRTIARMKSAGLLARETMAGLTDEDAPKTQKAAAEMMTAVALEFMAGHDEFSTKEIREVACAIRDCAQVSIKADQYIRDQQKTKLLVAAKSAESDLKKAGVNEKLIQKTIDKFLGVTIS